MTTPKIEVVGMFWIRNESEFLEFKSLFTDSARLPSSYARWLVVANQGIEELLRAGNVVVKAEATPDEFATWARVRGLDVDARGRIAFSNEKALEYARKIINDKRDGIPDDGEVRH